MVDLSMAVFGKVCAQQISFQVQAVFLLHQYHHFQQLSQDVQSMQADQEDNHCILFHLSAYVHPFSLPYYDKVFVTTYIIIDVVEGVKPLFNYQCTVCWSVFMEKALVRHPERSI